MGFEKDRSADLAAAVNTAKPRNVILIIGDGMDDSMITAARNYELGADGRFPGLDALPFTSAMTTHGLKVGPGPDYPIAYVSDSAPTASGWSTGRKTVDGRVSQGPSEAAEVPGEDYETVLERYAAQGKRTGNVTTAELTDATPAAAASHINARACQGPANMATCESARKTNGGKGSIAEQLVDNEVDVLLGGGAQRFAQPTDGGPTVATYAADQHGYRIVEDSGQLDATDSLSDGPLLGLFASGNMTPEYQPLVATPAGAGGDTARCQTANRGDEPDLAAMTAKAIELLDNDRGFFLQTESAMIDKQEHASDICGAIGDVAAIDRTVQVALEYQAENPDTLIVVTGDHSHSTQIVGGSGAGRQTATIQTADGDPMSVAYSTQEVGSAHTGSQIRVAASGPQAANVTGVIDQTDLFRTLLGRTPSKLPGPGRPPTARPSATVMTGNKSITRRDLNRRGLRVVTAASGAQRVSVSLVRGNRTLATRNLSRTGGAVTLRPRQATRVGPVRVVVRATGPGGTARDDAVVRVRR